MTILETKMAIAPISDLSDVLFLQPATESEASSTPGGVRMYAGGRRRVISTPGKSRGVTLSWRLVSRDDYERLLSLVGVPVLIRDTRQRRVFGVFFAVAGSEWRPRNELEDISITVEEISHSEIV